ncbi:chromosomal replication initiator protein DnaA [candidate division GN15 bacterium]|jgi:chromosomal replication initiator protein|nr:chromosomal replication initiator protein DnaA [candidate division GN15 bacterium]
MTRGGIVISHERISNSNQWRDCLEYIARRMKEQSFNTWLKPTKGEPDGNGSFKIAVPNQFVADWINGHFRELIDEAFVEVLGNKYEVVYVITGPNETQEQTALELFSARQSGTGPIAAARPANDHNLNERYSFESLVVGDFNSFACAASMAVAEAPGMTKYNPLFIYGGTGLGKTHIIQAIGNRILNTFPGKRVMYATSEKFTSDFIASISDRAISDFTRMYRDVDVLVIDDIQFFTGKESTQEQFFHTFNSLYHAGKQIILSSDRPPRDIKGLEERLLSRFSWGLVTDLQAPDMEGRAAIIIKKLESEGVTLPENVITYIADRVTTNVRDLEGALTRLLAFTSLKKVEPTVEIASKVLADAFSVEKRQVTIDLIQQKSAEHFQVEPAMMQAKKKTAEVVIARQVAMYLSRQLTDSSLKSIGTAFGGRDHSTVIHACDTVTSRMSSNPSFRERVDKISASILY